MEKFIKSFAEFNESANNETSNLENPILRYIKKEYYNLNEVIEKANPIIDEILEKYEEYYKERNKEFTEADRKDVKYFVIGDLVNCLSNYILPTDKIAEPVFSRDKGKIIMYCNVFRDGERYFFETEVIMVKGMIRRWHYRYIPKTKLRKITSRFNQFMKDYEKYTNLIERSEDDLKRAEDNKEMALNRFNKNLAKTKEDISKEGWFRLNYSDLNVFAIKSYKDEADFNQQKKEAIDKAWVQHQEEYNPKKLNKEIKYYDKPIIRLQQKIADTKKALSELF